MNGHSILTKPPAAPPADDPKRVSKIADPDANDAVHLGVAGDTYTVLLSGNDTDGRYTLIDMHVPPGGGPPPHRHNFEESFTLLAGELQVTFRGKTMTVRTGETVHVPANAAHAFKNASTSAVRMLCICSPAGQEEFFAEIGVPTAGRTIPPPKPTPEQEKAGKAKAESLATKYHTEMLKP